MDGRSLRRATFAALWLLLLSIAWVLRANANAPQPVNPDIEEFRRHVIELIEPDWRKWRVGAESTSTVYIYLRADHHIPHRYDLEPLFAETRGMTVEETDAAIKTYLETEVFRPNSIRLFQETRAVIASRRDLDEWLLRFEDPMHPGFPVFEALSSDAVVMFKGGRGDFSSAFLTNYDIEGGIKIDRLREMAMSNLEKEYETTEIFPRNDGAFLVGIRNGDSSYQLTKPAFLLTGLFWRRVEEKFPQGAYLAFLGEKGSILLADKRDPQAKKAVRKIIDDTRTSALSRRIGPINCDNEENFLRLAEQKPQPTAGERSLAAYFAARVKDCNESIILQITGKLPPPDYTPVSNFIYERRDGRLEVVMEE
jgi:hypothetical protein